MQISKWLTKRSVLCVCACTLVVLTCISTLTCAPKPHAVPTIDPQRYNFAYLIQQVSAKVTQLPHNLSSIEKALAENNHAVPYAVAVNALEEAYDIADMNYTPLALYAELDECAEQLIKTFLHRIANRRTTNVQKTAKSKASRIKT